MKIEASIAAFMPCSDRFVTNGYKDAVWFEEQCRIISDIDGIKAMPLFYDEHSKDPIKLKRYLDGFGLRAGTICPDNYTDRKWKYGSLANRDPNLRKEIIRTIRESMDYCAEIGGVDILLWLAHDGYDYPFEDDYVTRWGHIAESLYEIPSYRKDTNITLEFKKNEPRTHQYISDTGKALLMCEQVGLDNIGVALDYGHALFGGENPAESAALIDKYKRLFHIHLNDNYRGADDDLIIGTISFWETLEFFYQLVKVKYDGWYVIDIYPMRMDGTEATKEFVAMAHAIMKIAKTIPKDRIQDMQERNDTIGIMKLLREYTLKV